MSTNDVSEIMNYGADKNNQIHADDSEEDVPGDFFDDFLKEDFMAGLDIVDDDAWDEDKIKAQVVAAQESLKNSEPEKQLESPKKKKEKVPDTKNSTRREEKDVRSKLKKKRYSEKDDLKNKEDSKRKRKSGKEVDDEIDIRRDPLKTKRDIERDKVRCEKDKEMKIISEKLKLVETGLVPPGMETEINIEDINKQKSNSDNVLQQDLREHLRTLKEKNRSPARRRKSPVRKSPHVSRRKSTPKRRSRSPRRDPLRNAISPLRRSPRRSPFRRLSPRRSPIRRRSVDRRRSRSHSPYYRSYRARLSPRRRNIRSSSRDSEREKWLKNRNRSRSPRRKRDEKKSFLQEIAEKLNDTRTSFNIGPPMHQPVNMPVMQPMHSTPMLPIMQPTLRYVEPLPLPELIPAPVPAPAITPVFPPQPMQSQPYDPYDQSFFIGTPNNFGQLPPPQPSPLTPVADSAVNSKESLIPADRNRNQPNSLSNRGTESANRADLASSENQGGVTKLFQDKQITLSEFLAVTAKPEVFSPSPTHLQEKIKVITRCHEAIKILENKEKRFSGKLVVHKTDKYKKITTGNFTSPLKIQPTVTFPFTDPSIHQKQHKKTFSTFINELLQKVGVPTKETKEDQTVASKKAAKEFFSPQAPPPPSIVPVKDAARYDSHSVSYVTKSPGDNKRVLSKMVQTDGPKCETCEKRKKIIHRSCAIQTEESMITFSVSTQVSEENFQPKFPKTQSIAALTPAQLLAKSRESLSAASRSSRIDMDNFDVSPPSNRSSFYGHLDGYGFPRDKLPFSGSSMYDNVPGGGGRGADLRPPRGFDQDYRYKHSYY